MQEKQQIANIRQTLIGKIRAAVEKQNGCIGTFYQNLGEHHSDCQTADEDYEHDEDGGYDDSPVVVAHNTDLATYCNYEAAIVFDLFLDEDKLVCTLNGEAGEDWDEPIENIQTDGLVQIVEWLVGKGFVEKEDPWRCRNCGSLAVQQRAWVDVNTNGIDSFIDGGRGDYYCETCEQHTHQVQESELMQTIKEWWGATEFRAMERITGYRQIDFSPDEGYQEFVDACHEWWDGKTTDEKISIYFENK